MQSIQEITSAIVALSTEERTTLRKWFDEFDALTWDLQIEMDVRSGKLEGLAKQALADFQSGLCKPL